MKHLHLALIWVLLWSLLIGSSLQAQTIKDTTLTMSDGVRIAMRYYIPASPKPVQGYPALLIVHGYGGNYTSVDSYARTYQANGYACAAYTVRGQGIGTAAQSEGGFSWFLGSRELEDCRAVLEWLRARNDVNAARVGMEGYSQGGLTTWGALCGHFNIRCAAPVIACPRMAESIMRNGCHNYFFVTALALTKPGNLVRPTGFVRDTLIPLTEQDDFTGVKNAIRLYDMQDKLSTISTPLFMQMGWQDDLFPCDEVFRAFHAVQAQKKLLVYDGGHALPSNAQTAALRLQQVLRFYAYWLKDSTQEASIMNADSMVCVENAATHSLHYYHQRDSAIYTAQNPAARMTLYLVQGSRLSATPPSQAVANFAFYWQNLSSDAQVIYRSQPLSQPFTMTAAHASLLVNSTGRKYQTNLTLWDFDSLNNVYKPITRGCYHVRLGAGDKTAERQRIEYDLSPQLYTIPAGHQIHAVVKFGFPPLSRPSDEFGHIPYPPQESAWDTVLSVPATPSKIELLSQGASQVLSVQEPVQEDKILWNEEIGQWVIHDELHVPLSTEVHAGTFTIEVVDIHGRTVLRDRISNAAFYTLHSSMLVTGSYTVVVSSEGSHASPVRHRILVLQQ